MEWGSEICNRGEGDRVEWGRRGMSVKCGGVEGELGGGVSECGGGMRGLGDGIGDCVVEKRRTARDRPLYWAGA